MYALFGTAGWYDTTGKYETIKKASELEYKFETNVLCYPI